MITGSEIYNLIKSRLYGIFAKNPKTEKFGEKMSGYGRDKPESFGLCEFKCKISIQIFQPSYIQEKIIHR